MKKILHLSDLHFGTEEPAMAQALLRQIEEERPTLVAISGDLTQRARVREFEAARRFIDGIAFPVLVVPGNHDIPLYDVWRRFLRPLERYKRYVSADLAPMYQDEGLAVLGLNTARSRTFKNGRLSLYQIGLVANRFKAIPSKVMKVLVTHHSFVRPETQPRAHLIGRHPLALAALKGAGVRLHLAGHFHQGFHSDIRRHHRSYDHSLLVTQAGTALSRRVRGEPNAYNVLRLDGRDLFIEARAWREDSFQTHRTSHFRLRRGEWENLDDD